MPENSSFGRAQRAYDNRTPEDFAVPCHYTAREIRRIARLRRIHEWANYRSGNLGKRAYEMADRKLEALGAAS